MATSAAAPDTTSVGYVDVAGVRTWHEVVGETGDPVLLLHGAFAGASSWAAQTPALAAAGFRVYLPERRGHAHTPDVAGPLSYSVMAADTCAYLEQVVGRPAHLVGWSDGAIVALLVAAHRPDLVGKLVLIGQYYNAAGRSPEGEQLEQALQAPEAVTFLRSDYDAESPDGPQHFDVVHAKLVAMVRQGPQIETAQIARVSCPTLVLQGDRDIATVDHAAAVASAVADGRLAILPGTHALPVESAELVNQLLTSFLRQGVPEPAWQL